MKLKFVIIILFLSLLSLEAQVHNGKFWGGLEVGYGPGLSDKGGAYNATPSNVVTPMDISSLHIVAGYYLNPNLSLGAGFGLTSYNPMLNTLPVFVDVRYHPLRQLENLFLNVDIGSSLIFFEDHQKSGFMTELAVGYYFKLGKKIRIHPALGYNLCTYKTETYYNVNPKMYGQTKHSLFFRIGLTL